MDSQSSEEFESVPYPSFNISKQKMWEKDVYFAIGPATGHQVALLERFSKNLYSVPNSTTLYEQKFPQRSRTLQLILCNDYWISEIQWIGVFGMMQIQSQIILNHI